MAGFFSQGTLTKFFPDKNETTCLVCKAFIGQIGDLIVDPSNEQAVWITLPVPLKVANTIQNYLFRSRVWLLSKNIFQSFHFMVENHVKLFQAVLKNWCVPFSLGLLERPLLARERYILSRDWFSKNT